MNFLIVLHSINKNIKFGNKVNSFGKAKSNIKRQATPVYRKMDLKKVEAMYNLFEEEIESKITSEFKLTTQEKNELHEQRENYLAGKSKTYSWAEAVLLA